METRKDLDYVKRNTGLVMQSTNLLTRDANGKFSTDSFTPTPPPTVKESVKKKP